jgi:eukaryotic-like serine/threonine-protein kinase
MSTHSDDELQALIDRITAGDTIDLEQIPAALRARPELARLLKIARVTRALDHQQNSLVQHPAAPREIGPWQLLRVLGTGGMGEVWLGERRDGTVEQQVAIKRLRADTMRFRDRLVSERRILARLEHPNIARFVDAGVDHTGSPWLALEYVEGLAITDWCTENTLSVRVRLQLFQKVCSAVAHAHRHLIVHRDLKPSNVLVNREGEPKLLDFGIAKLLDGDTGEHTVGALTPAYAAPEQLRGEAISTATDVYALGLLLFRLLAGRLPETRASANVAAVLALLDDEETQRPSIDARREPSDLPYAPSALEGDLDAIVAQAIRARPESRYGSVAELSADIARYLEAQPVRARKPSRWYRFSRFAKRNRGALTVGTAAALALLISFGLTLWQARRAERAAILAAAQAERADSEAASAKAQAARAKGAVSFVLSIFQQSDPFRRDARGVISLDAAFEDALLRADQQFADQPLLAIDLNDDFGEILTNKGRFDEAEKRLQHALKLAEAHHPSNSPVIAETLYNLVELAAKRGRANDGLPLVERALAILKQHPDADPILLGNVQFRLGSLLALERDYARAEQLTQEALALHRRYLPPNDFRLPIAIYNMGMLLRELSRNADAKPYLDEAVQLAESLQGADAAGLVSLLDGQRSNAQALGEKERTVHAAERMLEVASSNFPGDHPLHASALMELGNLRLIIDENSDGEVLLRRAIAMYAKIGSPLEARAWRLLGGARNMWERWPQALVILEQGYARCAVIGPADAECLSMASERVITLARLGRGSDALVAVDALDRVIEQNGLRGVDTDLMTREARAEALAANGQRAEARIIFAELAAAYTPRYGEKSYIVQQFIARRDAMDL